MCLRYFGLFFLPFFVGSNIGKAKETKSRITDSEIEKITTGTMHFLDKALSSRADSMSGDYYFEEVNYYGTRLVLISKRLPGERYPPTPFTVLKLSGETPDELKQEIHAQITINPKKDEF